LEKRKRRSNSKNIAIDRKEVGGKLWAGFDYLRILTTGGLLRTQ